MTPRARESRGSRLRVYVLVLVIVVTAPLIVGLATDAFSTATLSRQSNVDVVSDSQGPLGIEVSQPATGTTSEYLGLTNQFDEEVSVSVTLADGSKGDLVDQDGTRSDAISFSLAAGAREAVELAVPCEESLEGQSVAATIEVSESGVSGTFERSATIQSGRCSSGPQHEDANTIGGIVETGPDTAKLYLEAKEGYTLGYQEASYGLNGGSASNNYLNLRDNDGDGRYEGTITGLSPDDTITYKFRYGSGGTSQTTQTYTYTFQGDGGTSPTPTPTPTPTTTTTTTTTTTSDSGSGDRHVSSEYIAGLDETSASSVQFYFEANNGKTWYYAAVYYKVNGGQYTRKAMKGTNKKGYKKTLKGLAPGDKITYYFEYGNSKNSETYTYTFDG